MREYYIVDGILFTSREEAIAYMRGRLAIMSPSTLSLDEVRQSCFGFTRLFTFKLHKHMKFSIEISLEKIFGFAIAFESNLAFCIGPVVITFKKD